MTAAVTNVDFAILNFIQTHMHFPLLDSLMKFFTFLGNGGMVWVVLALCLCFAKKYRPCGIALLIGLLLGLLIGTWGLKNVICRPRPFEQDTTAVLLIPPPSGYSFPSGHALSSFTAAFLLLMYRVKYLDWAALLLACLVAFSRLYLFVHFPTDIIGGILLAAPISTLTYGAAEFIKRRKKQT